MKTGRLEIELVRNFPVGSSVMNCPGELTIGPAFFGEELSPTAGIAGRLRRRIIANPRIKQRNARSDTKRIRVERREVTLA
jgi:hypothetical protein